MYDRLWLKFCHVNSSQNISSFRLHMYMNVASLTPSYFSVLQVTDNCKEGLGSRLTNLLVYEIILRCVYFDQFLCHFRFIEDLQTEIREIEISLYQSGPTPTNVLPAFAQRKHNLITLIYEVVVISFQSHEAVSPIVS